MLNRKSRREISKAIETFVKQGKGAREWPAGPAPHVLVGPVRSENVEGTLAWYFMLVSGHPGPKGVHSFRITATDLESMDDVRDLALAVLMFDLGPLILELFDGEVALARVMAESWPTDYTRQMLKDVEADEASRPMWERENAFQHSGSGTVQ